MTAVPHPPLIVHVRIRGYRSDRRFRTSNGRRTTSDGRTFCGAGPTSDDLNAESARAALQNSKLDPRLAHWISGYCPDCLNVIEGRQP